MQLARQSLRLAGQPCGGHQKAATAVQGPGAERAMLRRDAVKYVGTAGVAGWLGVKPQTVTKWLRRYQDIPEPDAYIGRGRSFRMWLPEREAEWRAWACSRPGR